MPPSVSATARSTGRRQHCGQIDQYRGGSSELAGELQPIGDYIKLRGVDIGVFIFTPDDDSSGASTTWTQEATIAAILAHDHIDHVRDDRNGNPNNLCAQLPDIDQLWDILLVCLSHGCAVAGEQWERVVAGFVGRDLHLCPRRTGTAGQYNPDRGHTTTAAFDGMDLCPGTARILHQRRLRLRRGHARGGHQPLPSTRSTPTAPKLWPPGDRNTPMTGPRPASFKSWLSPVPSRYEPTANCSPKTGAGQRIY